MEPAIGIETETEAYTLIREIGRGGMGVVYLAKDHKDGDLCAVKVLHQHLTQEEMVRRFQTEAEAASKMNHAAIAKVRGKIAQLRSGQWYCMMEYVDGLTLTQLIARMGPLPLAMILDIIAPLCEALDLAHAAKIVHRDLKPDNVMVVLRADSYDPKLLDFGIAKLLDEPSVTRPGSVVGTLEYTAPEQVRGDPVDHRCDVYALGVMVYQMITGGHLPYDAREGTLYHTQMTEPPIDPRQRHAGVAADAVGPILSAIHIDAARRPPTAGTFAVMLARTLVGKTPYDDGMAIVQRRAPRLLVGTNLSETLRAPGISATRTSPLKAWSYDYHQVLGKGGFGEVLRGTKRGAVGFALPVAIKRILPEHVRSPEFLEMFHQEAKIAAALSSHPNIVKTIDHEVDPEGAPVIVMELIDGVDLDKLRQSGPLPYSAITFIICEMLEGLSFAHHLPPLDRASSPAEIAARGAMLGIIHRDLSHHNVMVSRHGAVKVMDFGIAKLRDKTRADGSNILKGKPAYMSPEQVSSASVIDCRSDLFSVGTMLWELLARRPLFDRETLDQIYYALMFEQVPRPSAYNAEVPPQLEAIAMRLLEREPKDRYQNAREVIAELSACEAASRTARIELQEVMSARFPPLDGLPPPGFVPGAASSPASKPPTARGTAPAAPHALAVAAPTAHSWDIPAATHGRSAGITPSVPRPRRFVATAGIGAAGAALAIGVLVAIRGGPTTSHVEPERSTPLRSPAAGTTTEAASSPLPQGPAAATRVAADAPPLSTLIVMTEPSDAVLHVSDATSLLAAGRSPLTVQVPPGAEIQIRAELSGFASLTRPITITRLERQTITLALAPIASSDAAPAKTVQRTPPAKPPAKPMRSPAKPKVPDDDQVIE